MLDARVGKVYSGQYGSERFHPPDSYHQLHKTDVDDRCQVSQISMGLTKCMKPRLFDEKVTSDESTTPLAVTVTTTSE